MVDVFGNDIISAYTGGVTVQSIYANGVQVWPESGSYYYSWTPVSATGSITSDEVTFSNITSYNGYFSLGANGSPSEIFSGTNIKTFSTNILSTPKKLLRDCSTLKTAYLQDCITVQADAFRNCTKLSYVSLPNCEVIYGSVFKNCTSITSISLPVCRYVGTAAFESCNFSATSYFNLPKCKTIMPHAFQSNKHLFDLNCVVDLPECKTINDHAFWDANAMYISSLSLPKCEYIGSNAFLADGGQLISLYRLNNLDLPVCSYIGYAAFARHARLYDVSLPKCEYIGHDAFWYCINLRQISLPVCSFIGTFAFASTSLNTIKLGYSGVCSLYSTDAFEYTNITSSSGSILVPSSLVSAYKAATNWSYYSSRIYGF